MTLESELLIAEIILVSESVAETVIVLPLLIVNVPDIPSAWVAELIGVTPSDVRTELILLIRESTVANCFTRITALLDVTSAIELLVSRQEN